jgi:hypothetical protein
MTTRKYRSSLSSAHAKAKYANTKRHLRKLRLIVPLILNYIVPDRIRIKKMRLSGALIILPIGFRCHTRRIIEETLGPIYNESLPFDAGFFSPKSIENIFRHCEINLRSGPGRANYAVCIKHENYSDHIYGRGIKFTRSTYKEIDASVANCKRKERNKYIDSTFGYYTLDMENKFILAHYNWHRLASTIDPGRSSNEKINISNINQILNRRIKRMLHICSAAKYVLMVYAETQDYSFMMIDDERYDLADLDAVQRAASARLGDQVVFAKKWSDVNSPQKILNLIKDAEQKTIRMPADYN